MDDIDLLTTKEAAAFLKFHPHTVSLMARRGKLPVIKVFGEYRFNKAALIAWLDEHTTTAPVGTSAVSDIPTLTPTPRPRQVSVNRDYAAEFNAVVGQAHPRKARR